MCIASSLWLLLDVVAALSNSALFGVVPFEKRFDALRKDLPPHSVLGYVSDNPNSDMVTSQGEFYLTQYTLAPAIILASTTEPLEVANFHNDNPDVNLLKAKHLVFVKNYGSAVNIYRYVP